MSVLKGVQAQCTLTTAPLNGRIRSAVATNTRPFVGEPIQDCATKLIAAARKSVALVRRHLKFSIALDYDLETHIALLTVQIPAQIEIPIPKMEWYKEVIKQQKSEEKRKKNKTGKKKSRIQEITAAEVEELPPRKKSRTQDITPIVPAEDDKKTRRKSSIEKEREEIKKSYHHRNDWRKG